MGQRPLERTVRPVREAEGENLALTFRLLHETNPWHLFDVIKLHACGSAPI